MVSSDIVLADIPQSDGAIKKRPVLLIKELPGFSDWLAVGISSQTQQEIPGWDIRLAVSDPLFLRTGLKTTSIVRLSFLGVVPSNRVFGRIGSVSPDLVNLAKTRLSIFLIS